MADQSPTAGVRLALYELQRYLSDQLAPLMAADSVDLLLLKASPGVVASAIQGWVSAQYNWGSDVPVSDYLFHSLKKIHLMSELDLLEPERVTRYLGDLGPILLGFCPEEDREILRANLNGLGEIRTELSSPVEIVHRQIRDGDGRARTVDALRGARAGLSPRRYELLVERLQRDARAYAGTASLFSEARFGLLTQILATAAVQSRTGAELEQYLRPLADLGVDAEMGQVFRALGRSLPGWAVAASSVADPIVEAMRRLVSTADDEEDGTERFGAMVDAAVEQFNEGSLVQAATMFDLAERIITERKLPPEILKSLRRRGLDSLSTDQLRRFAEKPEKHALLCKVLNFFPGLTVRGLLADLEDESRRDRRKLMLALLEVHGAAARHAALERLEACVDGEVDPDGFYRRNLVFLLRRIRRPPGAPLDKEVDLLMHCSRLTGPLLLVREAISALGQVKHEGAEQVLRGRLHDLEQMLMKGDTVNHGAAEQKLLLDRTVSALAGVGTPGSLRAIVSHSLKRRRPLGDTMARLEVLAGRDLSGDRNLLARLVDALRNEIPMKVLGLVVQQKRPNLVHLIQALSGTPAPAVREMLERVVQRFPERDFAVAASGVLAGFGASSRPAEAPAESLSGDVELFGLPNLLQTVAESRLTGMLTLADVGGQMVGTVSFERGRIRGSQTGGLRGKAAFYQLFEKPVPGTFTFQSQPEGSGQKESEGSLLDIVPLVVEGVRRYNEFKQARVLVPDDVRLSATRSQPTKLASDEEPGFVQVVWTRAASGVPPVQIEDALAVDSYRVRHLLAHWVEEGTLILS